MRISKMRGLRVVEVGKGLKKWVRVWSTGTRIERGT